MTQNEIIEMFRSENPRFTDKAVTDEALKLMCVQGDKDVCARTRCIVGESTISSVINVSKYDLTNYIPKFFDIDEFPGGGVAYDDERLDRKTISSLDSSNSSWRTQSSGTPEVYFRRGKYIYLVATPDESDKDIDIYTVLISDDFDSGEKTPYNQLSYLEPYHYALVKFLKWKCEQKKGGDRVDALAAKADYEEYVHYMKKMLGGTTYGPIRFIKPM